jgi:succinate dehydrogenase (ubiquinone) cytochrome b560 subunit
MSANSTWRSVLYGFSLAYLFAPSTFSSANIIEFAAGQPEWVKLAEKTILAAPFAFHSLNGLRHLAWDTGKCLSSCLLLYAMR